MAEKMNNLPKENEESEAFAQWLRANNLSFTHIANESGLPQRVAMLAAIRKKRMGVSPGFPDFLVILPKKGIVFVEMKRQQGSRTSPEQHAWIDLLNTIPGSEAKICKGWEEASQFINEFL